MAEEKKPEDVKPVTIAKEEEVKPAEPNTALRAALDQALKEKNPEKVRKAALDADKKKTLTPEKAKEIDKKVEQAKAAEQEKPVEVKEEAKEEPKKEEKKKIADILKAEPEQQTKEDGDTKPKSSETDDDELEAHEGDSERYRRRVNGWKGKLSASANEAKAAKEELAKAQQKLAELEQKVGQVPDNVKKQLEELEQYRYQFDLQNAPEVKAYADKINETESTILETLAPLPWLADAIKKSGGINQFSKSQKKWTIKKGEHETENVSESELYKRMVDGLSPGEQDLVRGLMVDHTKTAKEREKFIKEKSSKAKEHFAELEKKQSESSKAREQAIAHTQQAASKFFTDFSAQEAWIKDVDDSFGPDYKEENARRGKLRSVFNQIKEVKPLIEAAAFAEDEDRQGIIALSVGAVRALDLQHQVSVLSGKLKAAEAEVKKLKGAGISTTKTGNAGTGSGEAAKPAAPAKRDGESQFAYDYRIKQEELIRKRQAS